MQAAPDYGRKLTQQGFEQAVVDLYDNALSLRPGCEDDQIRRRELNSTIDHRPGVDFPQARRDALWRAHQQVEQKRLRFAAGTLLAPIVVRLGANRFATLVLKKYARVLTADELRAYFGQQSRYVGLVRHLCRRLLRWRLSIFLNVVKMRH